MGVCRWISELLARQVIFPSLCNSLIIISQNLYTIVAFLALGECVPLLEYRRTENNCKYIQYRHTCSFNYFSNVFFGAIGTCAKKGDDLVTMNVY